MRVAGRCASRARFPAPVPSCSRSRAPALRSQAARLVPPRSRGYDGVHRPRLECSRNPPMTSSTGPHVRELTPAECHELIARNHVARIAFTWHDRVDIEPIGYVNDGDWIYGRTSGGTKLSTLLHHPWCAVEMDEVSGLFDWTSVVVKGTFHLLDPETSSSDAYQRAE